MYKLSKKFLKDLRLLILSKNLEYKTNKELYHSRDNALISGLILSGLRASEIVLLKKAQIFDYAIYKARTIKGGDLRTEIPLSANPESEIGKLTNIFLNWIDKLPHRTALVFPRGVGFGVDFDNHISRVRVFQIVYNKTGYYPHFFRSVHATIWSHVFNKDAFKLKSFMGWKNLNSASPYVKSIWEQDKHKINEVF